MRRVLSVLAVTATVTAGVATATLPAAAAPPAAAPMSCQNPVFCYPERYDITDYIDSGWTPAQIEALNDPELTQQLVNVCLKAGPYRPVHLGVGNEWDPRGQFGLRLHREGCPTPLPWPPS
ncbi:hypothetical protein [Streptomyces sp. NPDC051567]|uniref:hypothetical protein n=1 Tax=Streptomyces sp. NPDC051567 TaxID=3365660 RepID=UPI0037B11492